MVKLRKKSEMVSLFTFESDKTSKKIVKRLNYKNKRV